MGGRPTRYVIGIDVGQSGIGKVAIRVDSDGMPVEILNANVTVIDAGKDPASGKTPKSRLATAGQARRVRRRFRRRRQRLKRLARYLAQLGYLPPDKSRTYDAWLARRDLAMRYEPDEAKRAEQLALAIMHIARHRGWRSPWWSYRRLETAPAPTPTFAELQQRAAAVFGRPVEDFPTIGAIGAAAASPRFALRLRSRGGSLAAQNPHLVLFHKKILQEDVLYELKRILSTQRVDPGVARTVCEMVFDVSKPYTRGESVGRDPIPKHSNLQRAPRSSLEFQELRIRQVVANVRVRGEGGKRRLTREENERLVTWLMDRIEAPSWAEVAQFLGLEPEQLTHEAVDDPVGNRAPILATKAAIERGAKDWPHVYNWWTRQATHEERSLFACFLGDTTDTGDYSAIEAYLEEFPEDELVKLMEAASVPKGRAAYSRATMRELCEYMAEHRVDLHGALTGLYGLPAGWKPPAPSIFERLEYPHPTVDQITRDVARWLQAMVSKYGTPERVTVEHVREAFMGVAQRAEYQAQMRRRQRDRERIRAELVQQGYANPTEQDIRRFRLVTMQNGECLYCGEPITLATSELDHIVPRSVGGSNRSENVVAVCKRCNQAKGKNVFSQWAAATDYASVEEALARVDRWDRPRDFDAASFNRLKRDVKNRLRRKSEDDPIDERSLASTAYAAREIAQRIQAYLGSLDRPVDPHSGEVLDVKVQVLSGGVVSEARKASGIDKKVRLRGFGHKTRLDRRHHAIDAAVAATLRLTVGKVLVERRELRDMTSAVATPEERDAWKAYEGSNPMEVEQFRRWKARSGRVAELMERAIAEDRVTVRYPLRLGPNVGSVHDDTIFPLHKKPAREAFTPNEVLAIADPELYIAALPLLDKRGGLPKLAEREPTGTVLDDPDGVVELFPSWDKSDITPYLRVRGGAAKIGSTVHHARLYAVPSKRGPKLYQMRVFAGEFASIGFKKAGVDLFTAELPVWSQSYRAAPRALRDALEAGTAVCLGWLVPDDELEFPLEVLHLVPSLTPPAQSEGQAYPLRETICERRWRVSGFEDADRLNLKPVLLASEEFRHAELHALADAPGGKAYFGMQGWRLSVSKLVELRPTVIRRTASGTPRWRSEGSLPTSWRLEDVLAVVTAP